MQLTVEVKLDPKLEKLLERFIVAMKDLASMIGTATGYKIKNEEK